MLCPDYYRTVPRSCPLALPLRGPLLGLLSRFDSFG